jgi:anti-sigma factor RsiW
MCILGRCTPEEEQHSRECPECRAELARFQGPVSTFRVAMQDWSDRETVPRLAEVASFLGRSRLLSNPAWRWALVGLAVVILTGIPLYMQQDRLREIKAAEAAREDVLLMDAVSIHLSRTIPAPMEPILALVPDQESEIQPGGTQ